VALSKAKYTPPTEFKDEDELWDDDAVSGGEFRCALLHWKAAASVELPVSLSDVSRRTCTSCLG